MNLTRLKKRETSRAKRERDVLEEYEFFDEIEEDKEIQREDDDMNDFIENDENDERAREQAREALGIEDEEDALKEAFYILSTGQWPLFLELGVIQQWFKPVYVVLNSFGNGDLQKVVNILWKLCWSGELKPKLLILGYQDMCICCGNTRHVQYELYYKRSGNLIGGIGTDCYEIKFCHLLKLASTCRKIAKKIDSYDFYKYARTELKAAMDPIIHACKIMAKKYKEKKARLIIRKY